MSSLLPSSDSYTACISVSVNFFGNNFSAKSLKDDYRKFYGTFASFGCHGVDVAKETNYCEIDNSVVDKCGIPVLRFNYQWGSDEIKQAKHMYETTHAVLKQMGGIPLLPPASDANNWGLANPGQRHS
jgi:hypothetical protein